MIKDMEKEKNIMKMENYNMKVIFYVEDGMEKEKNIMKMDN